MLDLMAVNRDSGPFPLYLHAVSRILRSMRVEQQMQEEEKHFNYLEFKSRLDGTAMTAAQPAPLAQRLDTLESFMPERQMNDSKSKKPKARLQSGNDWTHKVRERLLLPCLPK